MNVEPTHTPLRESYQVKNMTCSCCIRVIRELLEESGVTVEKIVQGRVTVWRDPATVNREELEQRLSDAGFPVIRNKELILTEQIRLAVIELVHHTTFNAMVKNSDFLVEKFNLSYPYLATIFSRHTGVTLERYIILNKIEKVKELIEYGELTLSEIAYMMGYSSVQYLSTQFKVVTGISVTEYKHQDTVTRIPLDQLV